MMGDLTEGFKVIELGAFPDDWGKEGTIA